MCKWTLGLHLLFGIILVNILIGSLSAFPKSRHFLGLGVGVSDVNDGVRITVRVKVN